MRRLTVLTYASAIALTAGMVMWLSGALVDVNSMENTSETIGGGERLKVHAKIDPSTDAHGIYVVRADRLEEGAIEAYVLDPLGYRIVDIVLDTYSMDSRFRVGTAGTYTLVVINSGGPAGVTGAIGPAHDEIRILVSEAGFAVMLGALAATVLCSAVLIKKVLL